MRNIILLLIAATLVAFKQPSPTMTGFRWPEGVQAPKAENEPKEFIAHGDKRIDDYYWLNLRENQRVLIYLKEENTYLNTLMSGTKELREKPFLEMKGRIKEKDE